jgi:hypothetical protein
MEFSNTDFNLNPFNAFRDEAETYRKPEESIFEYKEKLDFNAV